MASRTDRWSPNYRQRWKSCETCWSRDEAMSGGQRRRGTRRAGTSDDDFAKHVQDSLGHLAPVVLGGDLSPDRNALRLILLQGIHNGFAERLRALGLGEDHVCPV